MSNWCNLSYPITAQLLALLFSTLCYFLCRSYHVPQVADIPTVIQTPTSIKYRIPVPNSPCVVKVLPNHRSSRSSLKRHRH